MEIKNEALKSLYEDLVSDIWSFSIETAFKKCDDELQSAYNKEHSRWVELAENYDRLETKYRRLERENEDLKAKKDNVLAFYRIKQLEETNERLKNELMEANDTLEKANSDRNDLLRKLDAECKKKQDLQHQVDMVGKNYCEAARRVGELVREKGDLRRQLGSLNTSLERLRERYEEEVVCRRKWAKLAGYRDKRIEELLKTGYGIDVDEVYKLKGMEELWAMIREVNSAPIAALYGSGAFNNKICVGTILNMYPDVRDFVKEYKTWKGCAEEEKKEKEEEQNKQKRLDDMRDYLHKFCENRWCDGCPLSTDEFKCGRGYRFRNWCFPDNGAVPDEDLKRYYEKVRDWEKKEEEKTVEEVPCSFNWKLDGAEYTIETSIPRKDYDNIVKIISGKE